MITWHRRKRRRRAIRTAIKILAVVAAIIWGSLFIKQAFAMSNDRALIEQILIEMCAYNTDCGFNPALHPPPRKPV